ncbi:nuclear transport factor 2 family protein [Streptomyces polygonati]|uniref:Nuclear transport factor 2 family protein n=1 Tax=Streptomyces polygonati TaxID=1617087 RepID=A0ABV8HVA7_9ACTN
MSSDITTVVKQYLETWNTLVAEERRALVDKIFTEDVEYVDPNVAVQGRAALDSYIEQTQKQFPGFVFSLAGDISAHHDVARFTWHVGPPGAAPVAVGYDFAAVRDGQVRQLYGFFS